MGTKTILCDSNFCSFQNNMTVSNFSELAEKAIYDIVLKNKYRFALHPFYGTELLKPLEFPELREPSSYANKVSLGLHLRIAASCQRNQPLH